MKRVWVFCDGSTGALGSNAVNGGSGGIRSPIPELKAPTTCGAGAVALDADGQIVGWEWRPLPAMTNNEAEYAGLLLGIGLAARLRADETTFLLDSEIVVGQMTGRCAVNSRSLHRWYWQACAAVRELPAARFCAIPREWNRVADGLACQAGIPWAWLRQRIGESRISESANLESAKRRISNQRISNRRISNQRISNQRISNQRIGESANLESANRRIGESANLESAKRRSGEAAKFDSGCLIRDA